MKHADMEAIKEIDKAISDHEAILQDLRNNRAEAVSRCDHKWEDGKGSISITEWHGETSFYCDICNKAWTLD